MADLYAAMQMFIKGEYKKTWQSICRPAYKALTPDSHNLSGYTREAERLLADSKKSHTFTLDPNAWLVAFGITSKEDQDRYNQRLIERVRTVEEREQKKRERLGKKVMGAEKLRNQCFDTTRLSSRAGKRMWCMSENRDLRIRFIEFLKSLFVEARSIRERWKVGDYSSYHTRLACILPRYQSLRSLLPFGERSDPRIRTTVEVVAHRCI